MKKFLDDLKGARKIEWYIALFAIAALLLSQMGNSRLTPSYQTELENRLVSILSRIDGVGKIEVMITEDQVSGILVVAQGADDLRISLRLQHAVQTLLGTEASRIEIIPYQD